MYDARKRARKPRWLWLYAIVTSLLGVLGLVEAGMAPGPARHVVELTVTIMLFGAMALWVRVNRVAIMTADERARRAIRKPPTAISLDEPLRRTAAVPRSSAVEAYLAAVNGSERNVRSSWR